VTLTLVIGGTRSGKSAHAERLALDVAGAAGPVTYVATADGGDPSMADRIRAHEQRRPEGWRTVEAGDGLAGCLPADGVSLIDGLGMWLAGILHRGGGSENVTEEVDRLIAAAERRDVIVVAEEAGQGLLPLDALARDWLDLLGETTQRLSAAAQRVDYVVAGRPITLTDSSGSPVRRRFPAGETSNGVRAGELRVHGDREVRAGDEDHAVNVLAGGMPGWLREALDAALDDAAQRYPDERAAAEAIARLHGRRPDEIVVSNGAAEALWLLGPALAPRLAACVHPGFTEAEAGLRAHGTPVVRVLRDPGAGFRLDPGAVPAEADLVIVGNPSSPSGTLDPAAALLALRAPGRTLVVDEAFMSMVPGEPGALVAEPLPDVIVVRSLTKLLSVPGLRVGYAVAPPELAAALRDVRPPWSANALALAALRAAAGRGRELAALAERAAAEGDDLQRRLRRLPRVRTWPSVTNFCLIEVPDGPRVVAALRDAGIAVRPAASFPGLDAGHVRLTARDPQRNERLVGALAGALA
jgi:histidinol-phosphate aminotransferase